MAKQQRVFIDDDSGEPSCLVGDLDKPTQVEKAIRSLVENALDELRMNPDESRTLTLSAINMSDKEVESLPEI